MQVVPNGPCRPVLALPEHKLNGSLDLGLGDLFHFVRNLGQNPPKHVLLNLDSAGLKLGHQVGQNLCFPGRQKIPAVKDKLLEVEAWEGHVRPDVRRGERFVHGLLHGLDNQLVRAFVHRVFEAVVDHLNRSLQGFPVVHGLAEPADRLKFPLLLAHLAAGQLELPVTLELNPFAKDSADDPHGGFFGGLVFRVFCVQGPFKILKEPIQDVLDNLSAGFVNVFDWASGSRDLLVCLVRHHSGSETVPEVIVDLVCRRLG